MLKLRGKLYYVSITVGDQRIRKTTGTGNKKLAQEIHDQLEAQLRLGLITLDKESPKTTLKQAWREAQVHHYTRETHKSLGTFQYHYSTLAEYLGEDTVLGTLRTADLRELVQELREEEELSNATINRKLSLLHVLMKLTAEVEDWGIPIFPSLKESKGRLKWFTVEEEQQIVDTLLRGGYTDVADLVQCLVDTGCRRGELLQLKSRDVDLVTNMIHLWDTKNGESRSQRMTSRVKAILSRRVGQGRVFDLAVHQVRGAWDWARKELRQSDNPEWVIHALRHTAASRLIQAGHQIDEVKSFMGHKCRQTTERYAHLNPENQSHLVATLECARGVPQNVTQMGHSGTNTTPNRHLRSANSRLKSSSCKNAEVAELVDALDLGSKKQSR